MPTRRSAFACCRSGRCTSVGSQITSRLVRCQLAKVPQQGQREMCEGTSEGVALALRHRGATSSDTAESALNRPMWKIRDCGSEIARRFDPMEAPIEVQYELPTSLSVIKDFQQRPCAVRNQPCLANVTLGHMWTLGSLSLICGFCFYRPQIKARERGGWCAAINFYTSNEPQVTDYTFNRLSPPRSRLELTCSVTDVPLVDCRWLQWTPWRWMRRVSVLQGRHYASVYQMQRMNVNKCS